MRRRTIHLVLATSLLASGLSSVRGEISVHGDTPPVTTLISGEIVDDPDPVGPIWDPVGPVLGPGTLMGDGGRPDIVITPGTGAPLVVWAATAGTDHDIAFASWTGSAWSPTEYLSSGPAEELDPRIFLEPDGTIHVTWWQAGVDKVFLATRHAGNPAWELPVPVSKPTESARRPSVARFEGKLWVAYERDSYLPGMAQDLVVARQQLGGGFAYETVASTDRVDGLDAVLHVRPGVFWLDWMHSEAAFGCVELEDSGWSALASEPWVDHSWVGVEEMRKILQQHVLESP